MKKIGLLIAFLAIGSMLYAQDLKVYDLLEAKAIERARVTVPTDDRIPLYTDDRGMLSLESFIDAREIIISALGYETVVYSYEELKALNFKVGLEPSRLALDQVVVAANRWSQSSRE